MLAIYLAALAFGLVLIGASVFLGGDAGDHDPGHVAFDHGAGDHETGDHGAGHDTDDGTHGQGGHVHVPHAPGGLSHGFLSDLLSLRFWTWALGAFGMAGAALTLLNVPAPIHLPLSTVLGVVVGSSTAWAFRRLKLASVGAPPAAENLLGAEGEVVLPVRAEGLGKVRLRIADQDFEVMARGSGTEAIGIKEKVIVIRYEDGIAHVRPAPWKDLE